MGDIKIDVLDDIKYLLRKAKVEIEQAINNPGPILDLGEFEKLSRQIKMINDGHRAYIGARK